MADGGEDNDADQEAEAEKRDEGEVVVNVASLREQLDEIRTNMAANNDRLDDTVLNKLYEIFRLLIVHSPKYIPRSSLRMKFRCGYAHVIRLLGNAIQIV